ncbi:alpha-1,6-mannosyltransferase [Diplogelasinospora grovesii]|uniref:Alpha-1,6-mannosyltransferase n=1 Tax=Diplogelasinospora grovesii TaxID=303347 RepID=A0AAN6MZN8_9PEZI|nr:alpha-1,6-mannosyltransferase [Diplogelasinospora grovesii]
MLAQFHQYRRNPLPISWRKLNRSTTIYIVFSIIAIALLYRHYSPIGVPREAEPGFRIDTSSEDGLLISRKIWQIMLPPSSSEGPSYKIDPEKLGDTASWLAQNPDYPYKLVGQKWADAFIGTRFAGDARLLHTYHSLQNPGSKSDLLRYLILSAEGGVYTDTDTVALKPIDVWVPAHLRRRVRLIVGIEFDQLDGGGWAEIPHELQFCQWTIAAAPGHPVFPAMVERSLDTLEYYAGGHNLTVSQYSPTSFEVMNSTGPAAWTDVVFAQLQLADPEITTLRNLSGMTEPTLYGDILVLPIDGFGMGQPHSNSSSSDGPIPEAALVKHNFRGSWRSSEG